MAIGWASCSAAMIPQGAGESYIDLLLCSIQVLELHVTEGADGPHHWYGSAVGHLGPGWQHEEFWLRLHELEAVPAE